MQKSVLLVLLLIIIGIGSRLLFIPNFTAVGAVAILGGSLLHKPLQSFAVTLLVMLVSDLIINKLFFGLDTIFYDGALYVYVPILAFTLIARFFKTLNFQRFAGLSAAFTVLFFLVSNFGVFISGTLYAKTFAGLQACYVAALPFALNIFVGTLLYGGIVLGIYKVATQQQKFVFSRL